MNKNIVIPLFALIIGGLIGFSIKGNNSHDMHSMSMDQMMMDMNAELVGKTGNAFDQAFLEQMIVHHEGAIEMAELALESSERQEIKDLATAIIKAQTTEINQMKDWQMSWE